MSTSDDSRETNWKLRIAMGLGLLVLLLIGYLIAVMLVPREWSRFIGNRVDGRLLIGSSYGLVIGFVCTLLPLVILRQTLRPMTWAVRGVVALMAAVAAVPNLMTLSVVWGSGNAAHAGERILDVDGPGFRGGSAWGAAFGVLAMIGLVVFRLRMNRGDRPSKELKRARKAAGE